MSGGGGEFKSVAMHVMQNFRLPLLDSLPWFLSAFIEATVAPDMISLHLPFE